MQARVVAMQMPENPEEAIAEVAMQLQQRLDDADRVIEEAAR